MSNFHQRKAIDTQTKLKVRLHFSEKDNIYKVLHRASGEVLHEAGTETPIVADTSMIGPGRRFVLE
jgi:hypothetical protein